MPLPNTPQIEAGKDPEWIQGPGLARVGRYLVGPELGRGGMGVVHEAWDPLLRRRVALKFILAGDPLQSLRFLREAQNQARVDHPGVCKVFEVSADGERPYIAMQFLAGRPLGQLTDAPLREKALLMAEVAGALHAAHRQGLIHRDIKPSNILVEGSEPGGLKPFLVDFGLARSLESADLTLSWGMVGTPAFMSPEQARGDALYRFTPQATG